MGEEAKHQEVDSDPVFDHKSKYQTSVCARIFCEAGGLIPRAVSQEPTLLATLLQPPCLILLLP